MTIELPYPPSVNHRPWTDTEVAVMRAQYPQIGRKATAKLLGRTEHQIRAKAWRLGLKADRSSPFFKEWQGRAAMSKVGKKRPGQAAVLQRLREEGRLSLTPERKKQIGEWAKQHIATKGHSRGALGLKHTSETKALISEHSRRMWGMKTPKERRNQVKKMLDTRAANGTMAPNRQRGTWKAAWRTIGGKRKFYRSRWEANYARFLEWQKANGDVLDWSHEPETFWFKGVKRGCVSYLPDFRVTRPDGSIEYHEVKGWMDPKSKTKLKRMKKYHPTVVLIVIDGKAYKKLESLFCQVVPDWE